MTRLSSADARIVDPVLTNVARGYKSPYSMVANKLFPVVPVLQRGGQVIEFSDESFGEYNTRRAVGADMLDIEVGYAGQKYVLEQHALAAKVPEELLQEANAVPGVDLVMASINAVIDNLELSLERRASALALNVANYPTGNKLALSGTSQWSHASSTPSKDIENAKAAITGKIGRDPNVLVIGEEVYRALRDNADVRDRVKYSSGGEVNLALLASYFDVAEVVVGRAKTGTKGNFKNVWNKVAVLAFSNTSSLASMGSPSFGYTYTLANYPVVEQGYFNQGNRSWLYPVMREEEAVIVGSGAGYLLSNVVA